MAAAVLGHPVAGHAAHWDDKLRTFWRLSTGSRVDIVCSEIPENELPEYASQVRHALKAAEKERYNTTWRDGQAS
jgi:hypothetical protein